MDYADRFWKLNPASFDLAITIDTLMMFFLRLDPVTDFFFLPTDC
jgi:hypothetical protein